MRQRSAEESHTLLVRGSNPLPAIFFKGENMKLSELIEICGKITVEKGFDTSGHIKQLLLVASEVSEAMENVIHGYGIDKRLLNFKQSFMKLMRDFEEERKNNELFEESYIIAHNNNLSEELADACIRIFSYAYGNKINLEKAILDKIEVNKKRPMLHGKKF